MIAEEHLKELEELALGFETSAYVEQQLADALKSYSDRFNDGCRDVPTMRRMRVRLDCEATVRRSKRSAEAIRAAMTVLRREK